MSAPSCVATGLAVLHSLSLLLAHAAPVEAARYLRRAADTLHHSHLAAPMAGVPPEPSADPAISPHLPALAPSCPFARLAPPCSSGSTVTAAGAGAPSPLARAIEAPSASAATLAELARMCDALAALSANGDPAAWVPSANFRATAAAVAAVDRVPQFTGQNAPVDASGSDSSDEDGVEDPPDSWDSGDDTPCPSLAQGFMPLALPVLLAATSALPLVHPGNLDAPSICPSKLSTLRTWGVDPCGCEARSVAFSRARSVVSRWAAEAWPDSSPAARRRDIRTGALPPRFDRNTLAKPLRTPQHCLYIARNSGNSRLEIAYIYI